MRFVLGSGWGEEACGAHLHVARSVCLIVVRAESDQIER